MKALTLHQPWASLIADGRKTIETRSRPWYYTGPVAIHAGLCIDAEDCKRFGYDPANIPRGAVLCIVQMVECVKFPNPAAPPDDYGDFAPGRYGYFLKDVELLAPPIEARGYQGFWNWNPPDWAQIYTASGSARSLPSEYRA